jgi:hypothetical protein
VLLLYHIDKLTTKLNLGRSHYFVIFIITAVADNDRFVGDGSGMINISHLMGLCGRL